MLQSSCVAGTWEHCSISGVLDTLSEQAKPNEQTAKFQDMNSFVSFVKSTCTALIIDAPRLRAFCVLKVHMDVLYCRTQYISRNDCPTDAHLKMMAFIT